MLLSTENMRIGAKEDRYYPDGIMKTPFPQWCPSPASSTDRNSSLYRNRRPSSGRSRAPAPKASSMRHPRLPPMHGGAAALCSEYRSRHRAIPPVYCIRLYNPPWTESIGIFQYLLIFPSVPGLENQRANYEAASPQLRQRSTPVRNDRSRLRPFPGLRRLPRRSEYGRPSTGKNW